MTELLTALLQSDDIALIKRYLVRARTARDDNALTLLAVEAQREIRHALEKKVQEKP